MKKILLASDDFNFSEQFAPWLRSIYPNGESFKVICVSNYEDLLYKLYFENFDADILFMNLNDFQFGSSFLSFFEKDLQCTMSDILETTSNVKIALSKICQVIVNIKYNKQLDIISTLGLYDSLTEITENEMYGINLGNANLIGDVLDILDLIQEKTLK